MNSDEGEVVYDVDARFAPNYSALSFSMEVADDLTGSTRAELEGHAIVRVAFLNALLRDERVEALFNEWWTRADVPGQGEQIAHLAEECARRLEALEG